MRSTRPPPAPPSWPPPTPAWRRGHRRPSHRRRPRPRARPRRRSRCTRRCRSALGSPLDPDVHPFEVLAGFTAPDGWTAFGIRAPRVGPATSTIRGPSRPPPATTFLVDRSGRRGLGAAPRAVRSRTLPGPAVGTIPDLCRRVLGAPHRARLRPPPLPLWIGDLARPHPRPRGPSRTADATSPRAGARSRCSTPPSTPPRRPTSTRLRRPAWWITWPDPTRPPSAGRPLRLARSLPLPLPDGASQPDVRGLDGRRLLRPMDAGRLPGDLQRMASELCPTSSANPLGPQLGGGGVARCSPEGDRVRLAMLAAPWRRSWGWRSDRAPPTSRCATPTPGALGWPGAAPATSTSAPTSTSTTPPPGGARSSRRSPRPASARSPPSRSAAATPGLVLLDGAGAVLRPVQPWAEAHGERDAARLRKALGAERWATRGRDAPDAPSPRSPGWPGSDAPTPSTFARIGTVLLPHDWLTYRLAGRAVTDRGSASLTGAWSPSGRDVDPRRARASWAARRSDWDRPPARRPRIRPTGRTG